MTSSKAIHLIVIIGLIVYAGSLFNGFVWDDLTYIVNNPELQSFNLVNLVGPNTFNSSGYFRPLPAIVFSALYQVFGHSAYLYHLSQMILHICCTVLLFYFFRRFFSINQSFFLSLVFLVHPINVESVVYIGAMQSQLYFLTGGTALLLATSSRLSFSKMLAVHLLLLSALLTKEVSLVYYFLVYFYRLLFHRQLSVKFILMGAVSGLIYLSFRLSVLGVFLHHMQLIPISQVSFWGRILHIPLIFFYYLKTFFFPRQLAIDQIWTISHINFSNFYFPLVADLCFAGFITFSLIRIHQKSISGFREFLFFLMWYLVNIGFLMQVFPLDMTVADRWFYLPIIGLLGMLGVIYKQLIGPRIKLNTRQIIFILVFLVSLLSVRSIYRISNWRNPLTLYLHDTREFPNYDLENFLGAELVADNRPQEALDHFLRSASLLPHDTNLYNVGSVYESLNNLDQAKIYYQRALADPVDNGDHTQVRRLAYMGLIKILLLNGHYSEADPYLINALNEFPDNGTLWAYRAINDYKLSRYDSALSAAGKATRLLPNSTTDKLYQRIQNRQTIDLKLE